MLTEKLFLRRQCTRCRQWFWVVQGQAEKHSCSLAPDLQEWHQYRHFLETTSPQGDLREKLT